MLLFIGAWIISSSCALGQSLPPRWLHGVPKAQNDTYIFNVFKIQSQNTLNAKKLLPDEASYYMERDYSVSGTSFETVDVTKSYTNGKLNSVTIERLSDTVYVSMNRVNMTLCIIDQYMDCENVYFLCTLPSPSTKTVQYDKISLTDSYASDPATWGLSLIPGAAQMHKGDYLKGGLIMGGAVAMAGGLVAFESMRANYLAKIGQTHSADVKVAYNNKAGTCATMRNIFIGGLAALYVYNILDAFIAPGARRVIVTPAVTPQGQYGMAATYKF